MVTRMRIMSEALTDMLCMLEKCCGVALRPRACESVVYPWGCCGGHGNYRRADAGDRSTGLVPCGESVCEDKDDNQTPRSTTILHCKYGMGHNAYSAEAEEEIENVVV